MEKLEELEKQQNNICIMLDKIYDMADKNLKNYIQWYLNRQCSIEELCSISSWLRQFVCEKWLYVEQEFENHKIAMWWPLTNHTEYKYRLMLSSIQEDKEKFILDSIKL